MNERLESDSLIDAIYNCDENQFKAVMLTSTLTDTEEILQSITADMLTMYSDCTQKRQNHIKEHSQELQIKSIGKLMPEEVAAIIAYNEAVITEKTKYATSKRSATENLLRALYSADATAAKRLLMQELPNVNAVLCMYRMNMHEVNRYHEAILHARDCFREKENEDILDRYSGRPAAKDAKTVIEEAKALDEELNEEAAEDEK